MFSNSVGYKILLLVHIVTVVVAFGPNFAAPMLSRVGEVTNEALGKAALYVQLPAVIVMWVAGMGLVGMSNDAVELTQTWILLALVLFLLSAGLLFLISRAYRSGETTAVPAFTGTLHLALLLGVILMIWKPGL
jgi:uncharacterized membrane protein